MSGVPVLLLVRRTVVLEDAAALLRAITLDGRFSPVVICHNAALAGQLQANVETPLRIIDYACREVTPSTASVPLATAGQSQKPGWVKRSYVARTALALARLLVYRARATRLLRRFPARLLVVFEDRAPYPEMAYLLAARRRGAKTLLISFAASSVESDAISRRDRAEHLVDQRPWRYTKRWFARRFPGQVRDTEFGRMLFFGLPDTIALYLCGMLGGRNWHFGGGAIDLCTKISTADLDLARDEGAPVERFVVTGQPMMDAMHAARVGGVAREGIARAHSLRAGVPLVICAVPHAAEHGLISWDRHLALTRELFRALAASKADVLLSLHPRSSAETYRGIASDYGLRILTERLSKVLPAADVFVASYSSTVRWALLMGIPTIMADFLGFRYRQFAGLAGSVVVEDATALEQALTRLVGDRGGIERMSRLAMAGEPGTPFDGKACERIMREMARLLQLND